MRTLVFIVLTSCAIAQDYGPYDLGTMGGAVTFEVTTDSGTLILVANSTGGGTGGRNYGYSEARNGSSISGWSNERVSFSGVTDTKLVAAYYWWVSLSEDGSWGYWDELLVSVRRTRPPAPNRAPTIIWSSAPGNAAHGAGYQVAAHGHDEDGNLSQVNVWKNGAPFAFAGGGNGMDGDSGNWTSDNGPQTVTFTAQAVDSDGATSGVISWSVTIDAPPVVNYTLVTAAAAGGAVSAGGVYPDGTLVSVTAYPDAAHDFAGWSGDVGGSANPTSFVLAANRYVQANFAVRIFPLSATATSGGSVAGGGTYPYGTVATLVATADSVSRFVGWSGDASGTASTVNVLMNAPRSVTANFATKASQMITFPAIADRPTGAPPFSVSATASSGLPITLIVLSGPAVINGGQLQVTGPGTITVQASQSGDAAYLPAPSVNRTFNAIAPVTVRYLPVRRTLFQSRALTGGSTFVLQ